MRVPAAAALVVCALAVACAPAPPPESPSDLRVMTWNVLTARYDPADWIGTIAAWRPAVVGLQEICAGEAVALADELRRDRGLPYVAVPGPVRPTPAEDVAPVNAELRHPCHDGAVVSYGLAVLTLLPVTSATTGLYAPDHRDEQRGYQRLTLRAPDGTPLTLYNTHLGLNGVALGQIRDLATRAGAEPAPTVVVGDLNEPQGADPAATAPLRDRFGEVDPDGNLPTSPNDPGNPAAPAREKIDYLFFRGLVSVVPPAVPWVPASDHRPVIGTLGPGR
ncbi:endonuclease/exonuclease/phosphatase family protein [Actinomycetospora endophytica]|uniref:Endonuclease/exonuclease/phosphatase family protein n=1 Tax=Actinomycetospora endophytica TaxID=2291215 RepID=A0ABS8PHZ2_9PSEU|nr:endonuclease/exonuclease/phosphatase family protein [Actinomycetospora endophytica]MCD2197557.1 endonuclease/exonuclease/phosphatase family protein [Actinomycetospora endophytica]